MTVAYWNQWNRAEIMSMHGVELTDYHDDSEEEEEEIKEEEQAHGCCSSGCMHCLGFSWRDFM